MSGSGLPITTSFSQNSRGYPCNFFVSKKKWFFLNLLLYSVFRWPSIRSVSLLFQLENFAVPVTTTCRMRQMKIRGSIRDDSPTLKKFRKWHFDDKNPNNALQIRCSIFFRQLDCLHLFLLNFGYLGLSIVSRIDIIDSEIWIWNNRRKEGRYERFGSRLRNIEGKRCVDRG